MPIAKVTDVKPEADEAPVVDALTARAMDRVLASEAESQERIAACQRQCQERIAAARATRRTLLERAQTRIVALHTRAAQALEERAAAILAAAHEEAQPSAAPSPARVEATVAQLVTQLLAAAPDGH